MTSLSTPIEIPGRSASENRRKVSVVVLTYLLPAVFGLLFCFPFFWTVSTSLKTGLETRLIPPTFFPEVPQWTNYIISSIPDDFIDAARVDGASEIGIFGRIILPMVSAPASALAILTFIGNWNDFFWPLVVISQDLLRTIPLGLVSFLGEYQSEYNQMLAVAMMAIAPLLILFVVMQRRFIEGIALSGLKG